MFDMPSVCLIWLAFYIRIITYFSFSVTPFVMFHTYDNVVGRALIYIYIIYIYATPMGTLPTRKNKLDKKFSSNRNSQS